MIDEFGTPDPPTCGTQNSMVSTVPSQANNDDDGNEVASTTTTTLEVILGIVLALSFVDVPTCVRLQQTCRRMKGWVPTSSFWIEAFKSLIDSKQILLPPGGGLAKAAAADGSGWMDNVLSAGQQEDVDDAEYAHKVVRCYYIMKKDAEDLVRLMPVEEFDEGGLCINHASDHRPLEDPANFVFLILIQGESGHTYAQLSMAGGYHGRKSSDDDEDDDDDDDDDDDENDEPVPAVSLNVSLPAWHPPGDWPSARIHSQQQQPVKERNTSITDAEAWRQWTKLCILACPKEGMLRLSCSKEEKNDVQLTIVTNRSLAYQKMVRRRCDSFETIHDLDGPTGDGKTVKIRLDRFGQLIGGRFCDGNGRKFNLCVVYDCLLF